MYHSLCWRWIVLQITIPGGFLYPVFSQTPESAIAGLNQPQVNLSILLDTSAEMGFLVPQVRKEVRILNDQLTAAGRPPVTLREIEGASVDREGSTSLGARKNIIYPLKELFTQADTVYWITSLKGEQSPQGMFAIEEMLGEKIEGRPKRELIIRNIWQDQLQAGDTWIPRPPAPEADPLDLRNRPEEWYRLVAEEGGLILRQWQVPPPDFREAFGFPYRVAGASFLKKLDTPGNEAFFDLRWARDFEMRHGLKALREKEEWPTRLLGRRWLEESTLVPFLNEETLVSRSTTVLEALCDRETIEADLSRIDSARLGVIFGFGYTEQDLKQYQASRDKPSRSWRHRYMADAVRIVGETLSHIEERREAVNVPVGTDDPQRFYANVRIELERNQKPPEGPDPYAYQIAKLVREKQVDAVYLFTNGHVGGGDYGTVALDVNLIALAIREAGVRLFIRMPFEFGPVPLPLSQLAMASGGGVFRGRADDPDWDMAILDPVWPEPEVAEP